MLESFALYSTALTDEERELGFELVELSAPQQHMSRRQETVLAVAHRLSETDQIAKMNVPVIGGHSYRHERLAHSAGSNQNPVWLPVDSIVFPTAEQALTSVGGKSKQLQFCH